MTASAGLASKTRKSGSEPTDRQILYSVRYGRKCTFYPIDNTEITGYVAGIERYAYVVATVDSATGAITRRLVHKSCPVIELHEESTFDSEPAEVREVLTKIMGKFRQWANRQFQSPPN